jgi:hypothetical protein
VKRFGFVLSLFLAGSVLLFGQATATVDGRVVDPAGAAVPNATVSITSAATGTVRQTVTNGEGLYSVPALVPGNYNIKADFTGFSPAEKHDVELLTGATLTVDLQMSVSGVKEAVSVEASAALVETTQSTQGASIRQTEVMELPMLNRSMASLMTLIPGAREIQGSVGAHGVSQNFVSIGGGGGRSVDILVDGIENDDACGGTEVNYSLEGIQEFKTLTTGANAEYGKGTGQVLMATKSGTNQLHGSAFGYYRNQNLIRTDYFSDPVHGGLGKPPFSREQFGGSFGGSLIKDKLWYFTSVERIQQNFSLPVASSIVGLEQYLIPLNIGIAPLSAIPQPSRDLLTLGKINYQPNAQHSMFLRYSGEQGYTNNSAALTTPALFTWEKGVGDQNKQYVLNGAVGDTWVVNPTTVNQFTAQWLFNTHDTHYPICPRNIAYLGVNSCLGDHLSFPSFGTYIANALPDWETWDRSWQFRDDLSKQMGRHALKFGVNYTFWPRYGGFYAYSSPGTLTFFADPNTIALNLNGQYPQGFQTPGALKTITETSLANGANIGTYDVTDTWSWAAYAQDDFKVTPKLTMNFGVRWEAYNIFNSPQNLATNATYLVLKAIGSPYGKLPNLAPLASLNNFQPRIGIAWDPRGNGKDVFRLSFGIFGVVQANASTWLQNYQETPQAGTYYLEILANSVVGKGALANFIYGVTPLPAPPPTSKTIVPGFNTSGVWYDPFHDKQAVTDQYHLGWSHTLSHNSVIAVDHTDMLLYNGWRPLDINPLINGVRPLAAATQSVFGSSTMFGTVFVQSAINHARYDETAVHYERRFSARASFQVNYVLAWAMGMGGTADGNGSATLASAANGSAASISPQFPSPTGGYLYAPYEYGPTFFDERHRITATGVLQIPFKIQISPSLTFATARPYTLFSKPNPDGDGSLQVVNANGQPNGIGTQRGLPLFVLNTRVTRIFPFGKDGRFNIAAFAELYNLTDRANFGNIYGGNAFAPATYLKPTSYLGGVGAVSSIPNSFQVQFGGRFTF